MANIIGEKVPFFTPIESNEKPFLPVLKVFEHYLYFGDEVAIHDSNQDPIDGSRLCRKEISATNCIATVLKIITYVLSLGIFPLIALMVKAIARSIYQFHYAAGEGALIDRPEKVATPEPIRTFRSIDFQKLNLAQIQNTNEEDASEKETIAEPIRTLSPTAEQELTSAQNRIATLDGAVLPVELQKLNLAQNQIAMLDGVAFSAGLQQLNLAGIQTAEYAPISKLEKENIGIESSHKETIAQSEDTLSEDDTAAAAEPGKLDWLSATVKTDRALVEQAVALDPIRATAAAPTLQFASPDLRADADLVRQAIGLDPTPATTGVPTLQFASPDLRADADLVRQAIGLDPMPKAAPPQPALALTTAKPQQIALTHFGFNPNRSTEKVSPDEEIEEGRAPQKEESSAVQSERAPMPDFQSESLVSLETALEKKKLFTNGGPIDLNAEMIQAIKQVLPAKAKLRYQDANYATVLSLIETRSEYVGFGVLYLSDEAVEGIKTLLPEKAKAYFQDYDLDALEKMMEARDVTLQLPVGQHRFSLCEESIRGIRELIAEKKGEISSNEEIEQETMAPEEARIHFQKSDLYYLETSLKMGKAYVDGSFSKVLTEESLEVVREFISIKAKAHFKNRSRSELEEALRNGKAWVELGKIDLSPESMCAIEELINGN